MTRFALPRSRNLLLVMGLFAVLLATGCAKKVSTPTTGGTVPDGITPSGGDHFIDHTVAEGETLAMVADNYYGDPGRAGRIARDNGLVDPGRIIPGSLLRLNFSEAEWASARKRSAALAPYNKGVDLLANERLAEAENSSAWPWIRRRTWSRPSTIWPWCFSSAARPNKPWCFWTS